MARREGRLLVASQFPRWVCGFFDEEREKESRSLEATEVEGVGGRTFLTNLKTKGGT